MRSDREVIGMNGQWQYTMDEATHAAKIVYAFGQVQAVGAAGKARQSHKGDHIFPGETVATVRGRAQIKFTDGGFASLQPHTQYKIDDYNFAGEADGKERSFPSLIKGSVRLVTGVIGRANRNNFRLQTTVATIGIRGTLGKASHCDSDCGSLPVGTFMQGYGGRWDLKSGNFSGPVESGDAYLCDGITCSQVHGRIVQREEVGDFEDEEEDDDRYQQGQQVDRDGRFIYGTQPGDMPTGSTRLNKHWPVHALLHIQRGHRRGTRIRYRPNNWGILGTLEWRPCVLTQRDLVRKRRCTYH